MYWPVNTGAVIPKTLGISLRIFESAFKRMSYGFYEDGRRLSTTKLPPSYVRMMKFSADYADAERILNEFLVQESPAFPIILCQGKEWAEVKWDGHFFYESTLSLQIQQDHIHICRGGSKQILRIGNTLVADLQKRILGRFQHHAVSSVIWQHFKGEDQKKVFQILNTPLIVSQEEFNQNPLYTNQKLQNIQFLPTVNHEATLNYHIHVHHAIHTDYVTLEPFCLVDGHRVLLPKTLLDFWVFFKGIPTDLKTEEMMIEIRYWLLFMVAELSVINLDAIVDSFSEKFGRLFHEVKSEFRAFFSSFQTLLSKPLYQMYANQDWYNIQWDLKTLFGFWIFLMTTFFHHLSEDLRYPFEVTVPAFLFYLRFEEFHAFCKQENIELLYSNKPLEPAKLEVSLDPSQNQFDLSLMTETKEYQKWDTLLKNYWLIEIDGTYKVLDKNSQKKLKAIALMTKDTFDAKSIHQNRMALWALKDIGVELKLDKENTALLDALKNMTSRLSYVLPEKMTGKPRVYQKEGYEWLCFLYENRFGGILADDMGLGKTYQAILLLGGIAEKKVTTLNQDQKRPHLIIVPPSLLFNWRHEIQKFYPDLSMAEYTGKNREWGQAQVVLTTYDIVRRDFEFLSTKEIDVLILDEAQLLKNDKTERTKVIRQMKANFVLCLTGTPLENHLKEYFSLIETSVPGLVSEMKNNPDEELASLLINRVKPFVLRRKKADIESELPEKNESHVFLELSSAQQQQYNQVLETTKLELDLFFSKYEKANVLALVKLLRLRQICITPELALMDNHEISPKFSYLIETLLQLQESGKSALVFSQFSTTFSYLAPLLKKAGIHHFILDGKVSVAKRKKMIQEFQETEKPVCFLMTLKVGGLGLNLTKAEYVFHLDPWWNPAVHLQATDRVHRIGQNKKVVVQYLLMHNTIEEGMILLQQKKKKMYEDVLRLGSATKKITFTKDDFDFLLNPSF